MSGIDGKTIVVTGASSGIGRATAMLLARRGAKLLLVARDGAALEAICGAIAGEGGTADFHPGDVGRKPTTLEAIDKAERLYGPVDGYFANAGMSGAMVPMPDYSDEDFDAIIDVNLKSAFWALKRLLPSMIERKTGSFVATGSLASERGFPMTAGYVATKHALLGLVRAAAAEVSRHNVRVNLIVPGMIETRMTENLADHFGGSREAALAALATMVPMGRVGTPEEVGEVVAFLLSDASAYVSGQAWSVDGGILGTFATGQ